MTLAKRRVRNTELIPIEVGYARFPFFFIYLLQIKEV